MGRKAPLREEARAARRGIPLEERHARSERVAERFLALPEVRSAKLVACYASVGSEVGTSAIFRGLLMRGATVAVPVVDGDRLRFARLQHPWGFVPGWRGLPEPRQPWEELAPDALEVVAMPGLLFGRDGSRLGQGGGYFDRLLAQAPGARRVGLAFSTQVVDRVDVEEHDQSLDVLVTEAEILRFPRASLPR